MRNEIINKEEKLSKLKPGEKGVVIQINTGNLFLRRRLYDMGVTLGTRVQVKKIAPLGDPVCINLRGYELSLRKEELKRIIVRESI